MKSFFKTFFAALLALLVFTIIGCIILYGIVNQLSDTGDDKVGSKAVLVIDLGQTYKEQRQESVLTSLSGAKGTSIPGLYETVRLINYAKTDNNIKGIFVKCNNDNNGFASSEELRQALVNFKTSGKFILAYGDAIAQKSLYVASAAHAVYCNPKGTLYWKGLATTITFIKGTLDRLDIQPQIFYAGKFKSATEPLRETKMTDANRLQTAVWLNDLFTQMITVIGKARNIDTALLRKYANDATIQTPYKAATLKLIDAVKYDDEVKDIIKQKLNIEKKEEINFISINRYADAVSLSKGAHKEKIALIYAQGDIVDGKGTDDEIGGETFKDLIQNARLDEDVKAIVVRVNSPGGSSMASELMWRELSLAKKEKPVILSFGDYAASGGYYIACDADSIFAEPNTITGSIGVFVIMPNAKNFFNNKLGITFDGVKTSNYADIGSISRPLNDIEKTFVQNAIDSIYVDFKVRVSEGRKKSMSFVDSIAQGRVWSGERALQIGLIDKIGNLQQAVDCAARMAKLKNYHLKEYPETKSLFEKLFNEYKRNTKIVAIKEEIGEMQYTLFKQLQWIHAISGIKQSRLPYQIEIE